MSLSDEQLKALRELPSVNDLAEQVRQSFHGPVEPTDAESVHVARASLNHQRRLISDGLATDSSLVELARSMFDQGADHVINGTGVVLHTNLGRAPLPAGAAMVAAEASRGYVGLEIDLAAGRRGIRAAKTTALLAELTGAEDSLIVNNGAAAVLLAIAALAGKSRPTVVSRGDAIEIGGEFRIPDVIAQAGSTLVEVGTANRTRTNDYGAVLEQGDALVLRVHQSNFRTVGFVERPEIEDLCALGADVVDDLGSGALLSDHAIFGDEPAIRRSINAGAQLVCFSGDKLLGGPQAGLIVGRAAAIERCRRHPLARALRVNRMTVAALHETLALYRDPDRAIREIPVLAMLFASEDELLERAESIAAGVDGTVVQSSSRVGGGALPLLELEGPAVALPCRPSEVEAFAAKLRSAAPPLVARINQGQLLLDPRTIFAWEIELAIAVTKSAYADLAGGDT